MFFKTVDSGSNDPKTQAIRDKYTKLTIEKQTANQE
tara:strand:+ start:344 stop:451 length:108 start_codon:yes stop_codon:yes gene_type:complete